MDLKKDIIFCQKLEKERAQHFIESNVVPPRRKIIDEIKHFQKLYTARSDVNTLYCHQNILDALKEAIVIIKNIGNEDARLFLKKWEL